MQGHAVRHRRRSARRPAAPGRGGLSADVDGREGRRLGRDAAPRQGGRDQRALVQRAVAACRMAARGRRPDGAAGRTKPRERARESFNARFWYADGGYLYDVIDGEQGDDSACRPNQIFAISLDHPVLDEIAVAAGLRRRPRAARSRRLACDRWRPVTATTRRSTTATSGRATRPITREPSGRGWSGRIVDAWLRVYPSDKAGARDVPLAGSSTTGRGGRRHDQRDLRRRAAVHAARMHRAGVERG